MTWNSYLLRLRLPYPCRWPSRQSIYASTNTSCQRAYTSAQPSHHAFHNTLAKLSPASSSHLTLNLHQKHVHGDSRSQNQPRSSSKRPSSLSSSIRPQRIQTSPRHEINNNYLDDGIKISQKYILPESVPRMSLRNFELHRPRKEKQTDRSTSSRQDDDDRHYRQQRPYFRPRPTPEERQERRHKLLMARKRIYAKMSFDERQQKRQVKTHLIPKIVQLYDQEKKRDADIEAERLARTLYGDSHHQDQHQMKKDTAIDTGNILFQQKRRRRYVLSHDSIQPTKTDLQVFDNKCAQWGILPFKNPSLLMMALTHPSFYSAQFRDSNRDFINQTSYLEFLGDSAIALAATSILFDSVPLKQHSKDIHHKHHPTALSKPLSDHGLDRTFTMVDSVLKPQEVMDTRVDNESLAQVARDFGLLTLVRRNLKEVEGKEIGIENMLADHFEAFLGAIYLDQGFDTLRIIAKRVFEKAKLKRQRKSVSYLSKDITLWYKAITLPTTLLASSASASSSSTVGSWDRNRDGFKLTRNFTEEHFRYKKIQGDPDPIHRCEVILAGTVVAAAQASSKKKAYTYAVDGAFMNFGLLSSQEINQVYVDLWSKLDQSIGPEYVLKALQTMGYQSDHFNMKDHPQKVLKVLRQERNERLEKLAEEKRNQSQIDELERPQSKEAKDSSQLPDQEQPPFIPYLEMDPDILRTWLAKARCESIFDSISDNLLDPLQYEICGPYLRVIGDRMIRLYAAEDVGVLGRDSHKNAIIRMRTWTVKRKADLVRKLGMQLVLSKESREKAQDAAVEAWLVEETIQGSKMLNAIVGLIYRKLGVASAKTLLMELLWDEEAG